MDMKEYVDRLNFDFLNKTIGECECLHGRCLRRKIKIYDTLGWKGGFDFTICNSNITLMKDNVNNYSSYWSFPEFIKEVSVKYLSWRYFLSKEETLSTSYKYNGKKEIEEMSINVVVSMKPYATVSINFFSYLNFIIESESVSYILRADNCSYIINVIETYLLHHNAKIHQKKANKITSLVQRLNASVRRFRINDEYVCLEINNILIELINYRTNI